MWFGLYRHLAGWNVYAGQMGQPSVMLHSGCDVNSDWSSQAKRTSEEAGALIITDLASTQVHSQSCILRLLRSYRSPCGQEREGTSGNLKLAVLAES
jgi:hypothetical protein